MSIKPADAPLAYRNPIFSVETVRINGRNFMFLRIPDGSMGRSFLLARYDIAGDKLTIRVVDLQKVKTAVTDGKLKGTISGGMLSGVSINDRWAHIANVLKLSHSDDYFVLVGELTKVTH